MTNERKIEILKSAKKKIKEYKGLNVYGMCTAVYMSLAKNETYLYERADKSDQFLATFNIKKPDNINTDIFSWGHWDITKSKRIKLINEAIKFTEAVCHS